MLNKIRGVLYKTARILGDINAVKKGKIGQRILRREVGRLTSKLLGRLFRR